MGADFDSMTDADLLEHAQLLQQARAIQAKKQGSDTAWTPSNSQDSAVESAKALGSQALGGVVKGLDYQRGATTGPAIAQLLDAIPGGKKVYSQKEADDQKSFKGTYRTPLELLEAKTGKLFNNPTIGQAAGYLPKAAQGMLAMAPGLADKEIPIRGALDMGATAITDPMTYESLGLSALARGGAAGAGVLSKLARASGLATETGLGRAGKVARVIVNPLEAGLESASRANYGKAFEKADRMGEQMGKPQVVSDILRKKGFVGSMDKAVSAIQGANSEAGAKIGSIIGDAAKSGATVDAQTAFKPAMDEYARLKGLGNADADAAADAIFSQMSDLISKHGWDIPIDKAQDLKVFLDNPVYKNAGPAMNTGEAQGAKAIANETITKDVLKPGVESAVPTSQKPEFMRQKAAYASTDSDIQEKLRQMSNEAKERRGALGISDVGTMLVGGGLGGALGSLFGHGEVGMALGPWAALGAKQAKQAYQSTWARTARGAAQQALGPGTYGLLDTGARAALKESPWHLTNDVAPPATKGKK